MSKDEDDFIPDGDTHQPTRLNGQTSAVAALTAVFGAALGVASLFGEWSRAVRFDGSTVPAWTLLTLGPFGAVYLVALIVLVVIVVITLTARHPRKRTVAGAVGLVLSGLSLAWLGRLANLLARGNPPWYLEFRAGSTFGNPQVLGWGIYAAFGAVIAFGIALVYSWSAAPRAGS